MIGGVVTVVVSLLNALMNVWVGGGWSRRSVRADVELLSALPDDLRASQAGVAFSEVVEQRLLSLSGPPRHERWLLRLAPAIPLLNAGAIGLAWGYAANVNTLPWYLLAGSMTIALFMVAALSMRAWSRLSGRRLPAWLAP